MNQVKRQSEFPDRQIKKLRTTSDENKIWITSIESLSNELFCEIFDYIDGYHIYKAFSNLNHRFHQLLNSSSLLFKIEFDSPYEESDMSIDKQIILFNSHQILSVYLPMSIYDNQMISSFNLDSSFIRLESLVYSSQERDILISLLTKLASLPRLFSLTIDAWDALKELSDAYELIFALPKLRYIKFCVIEPEESHTTVSLPLANNKQLSTIEHLVIDHYCDFNEIFAIISYTPQLRRLKFMHLDTDHSDIRMILPITLSNLTHISTEMHCENFDDCEMFITKIFCKLKVLRLTTISYNMIYLDADRWERFFLQNLSQLEKFYLQYEEYIDDKNKPPIYFKDSNQFTSSFWIERQWLFEAQIDTEKSIYSVQPYKKRWYQYTQDKIDNSSIDLSKSARLTFIELPSVECHELLILIINRVLAITQIYHLEISNDKIFAGSLLQITNSLPELVSLKIDCLSLYKPRDLCGEEVDILCSIENTSKITNVYLEYMIEIQDVYFLMTLCPYMAYLKVNYINKMDGASFLQNILDKVKHERNKYLRSLCFRVRAADDAMIIKLQEMINYNKILLDYTITRILDNICLQWK